MHNHNAIQYLYIVMQSYVHIMASTQTKDIQISPKAIAAKKQFCDW